MSSTGGVDSKNSGKRILFVGTNLKHAVSNKIHDEVCETIGLSWRLLALDSPDLSEFLKWVHDDSFGGAIITIPHKIKVMSHLDRIDEVGALLGACNNVYKSKDGFLTGTNTDWIGVRDSLLSLYRTSVSEGLIPSHKVPEKGKPGFIIGAGGAARAAVYALNHEMGCPNIYIINRDQNEVASLRKDITEGYSKAMLVPPVLIHLRSAADAALMEHPVYGVGTVPDFEPVTNSEIQAREAFEILLKLGQGFFLDMCYKPRQTRNLLQAKKSGWAVCEGGQVVAWQLKAQWKLWAGEEYGNKIPMDLMIERVAEIAEELA